MKKKIKKINAAILIIGNEILSGRTQDKNVNFISNWLNSKCGISVKEVRIIPDEENIIAKNIISLSKKFNYVFTTGGIGPTHDDITAKSISKAFKVKYEYHEEAYEILSGRTQDKNVLFISKWLNLNCGISVNEVRIISDKEKTIVNNVLIWSKRINYVYTSGSIGHTHDDTNSK